MSVETFDPGKAVQQLPDDIVGEILAKAREAAAAVDSDKLVLTHLTDVEIQRYAAYASHAGWAEVAKRLDEDDLRALTRFFTLGEASFPSWLAGDKSPVIHLVAALKAIDKYTKADTAWIKAHTSNRFLPHGNLMHRL